MEDSDKPETDEEFMDVPQLRILLEMLRDLKVHSFQAGGITVVFEESEYQPTAHTPAAARVVDDGHSTSTKRVDGFKNPGLWAFQNGKTLRLDGTLE